MTALLDVPITSTLNIVSGPTSKGEKKNNNMSDTQSCVCCLCVCVCVRVHCHCRTPLPFMTALNSVRHRAPFVTALLTVPICASRDALRALVTLLAATALLLMDAASVNDADAIDDDSWLLVLTTADES